MIGQAIVFYLLVLMLDHCCLNKYRKKDNKKIKENNGQAIEGVPVDVQNHINEVKQAEGTNDETY